MGHCEGSQAIRQFSRRRLRNRVEWPTGFFCRTTGRVKEKKTDIAAAIEAHREGRLTDAHAGYRELLSQSPDDVTLRHHLGLLELQRGDSAEAILNLEAAAKRAPNNPALLRDLGRALMMSGQLGRAAKAFETALGIAVEHPDLLYNLALVRENQGRLEDADRELRRILARHPDHAKSMLRLGHLERRRGRADSARACFEQSLTVAPDNFEALVALAALDEAAGDPVTAEEHLRKAVAQPDLPIPDAHIRLSRLLELTGQEDEAIDTAVEATRRYPGHDIAWRQLGEALKHRGRLPEAVEAFSKAHAILRAPDSTYGMDRPEIRHTNRAKLRHDIEQLEYLKQTGIPVPDLDRLIAEHRDLDAALPAEFGDGSVVSLPPGQILSVGGHYNRCMHRAEAPSLDGGALNPDLDPQAITEDYFSHEAGITHIDDFLRSEALEGLRGYLLESTIWHDAEHPNGYVGAYLHDGFDCPLILQIADELPRLLPQIFRAQPLLQLWAYHYDSRLPGIGMHADFAAVNVNFWLTPDEAMLDRDSGGMRIWDVAPPADWVTEDYNNADPVTKRRIDDYLTSRGARELVIPHRQNRVVIFNSDLFHRTDDIRFREGFVNRRINVTMLYGRRGAV